MMKSLYSGVAGLKVHNQRMDVIGNNISNVNTTGYKTSTVTFKDVFYQDKRSATSGTIIKGGRNANQIGYGASLSSVSQVMQQSGFTYTETPTDCAIAGDGFFQVMDAAGNIYYTRNGSFDIDNYGNLVDKNGNIVLGVSGDPTGVGASSNRINLYVPPIDDKAASVSKTFKFNGDSYNYTISNRLIGPEGNISLTILDLDDGQTPFAVQNGESLVVYMDLNAEYTNVTQFVEALDEAIAQGDVDLGNGFGLDFDFESLPWDVRPVKADYTFANAANGINLVFTAGEEGVIGNDFTINLTNGGNDLTAEWNDDELTINIPASGATVAQIESAIQDAAVGNKNKRLTVMGNDITAAQSANVNGAATRTTDGVDGVLQKPIHAENKVEIGNTVVTFTAKQGGDKPNGYEIDLKVNEKLSAPLARWSDGVLTIQLPKENISLTELQKVIDDAAGTNQSKGLTVTIQTKDPSLPITDPDYLTDATDLTTDDIDKMGDKVYRCALTGGVNGFFRDFCDAMDTVRLTDGRYAAEQTTKNLSEIYIDDDGVIYGVHTVHGTIAMGRIDLAIFENPTGLNQVGSTYWQTSLSSGDPEIRTANDVGTGSIVANALEMSNVDLSQEISDMIITQRGYQANSRVITVTDTMLEELINLKR